MQSEELSSTALFTQYVEIVNRSIGQNRDRFPYKQLLIGADELLGDRMVSVAVYKEDRKNPHDWFTMSYDDGTFGIAQHGKSAESDVTWRVKESYLRRVVENPDKYIESPAKLDFDWLKSRVGMD